MHSRAQVMRVYYDRLVDIEDKGWMFEHLKVVVNAQLGIDFHNLFEPFDFDKDGKVSI